MIQYHDEEWGSPLHDDRTLFEYIVLDGMQAGLSWQTIINKRENFRRAFHGFDPGRVARYTARDRQRLLANPGIIRNRAKVAAAIVNAQRFLELQEEHGTFDRYIWQFTGGETIDHRLRHMSDCPTVSAEAVAMSKDLIKRGFKFVGPTICYAFMQAAGMVNDHLLTCFRYRELTRGSAASTTAAARTASRRPASR
jgi:DNA-3-methyladenine glycosylase I